MGISEYITEQKIERAKELLTSGNSDIQETVDRLGASNSYFTYMLLRNVDVTPGGSRTAKEINK